jgi:acetyl esterase/lipase
MRSEPPDLPPAPATQRVPYGPGALHFGDLFLPAGPGSHPLVLAVHGGFWKARYDLAHLGPLCAALAAEGLAVYSLEYRRVGDAGGGFPGTFLDVARAADFLPELARRHGLRAGPAAALGHSAGGHLALWLAGRHRVTPGSVLNAAPSVPLAGVVALAPVADLEEAARADLGTGAVHALLGGAPEAVPERYAAASPAALLPLGVRQVLVHGTEDDAVPLALSRAYVRAAQARGDRCDLETLEGQDHFAPIDPGSPAFPVVLAALRAVLG